MRINPKENHYPLKVLISSKASVDINMWHFKNRPCHYRLERVIG